MCEVFGCMNRSSKNSDISFHRFPKDGALRAEWIRAIGREGWQPSDCSRVCSKHFQDSDFNRSNASRVYLKPDSVPSIAEGFPQHLEEQKQKRRSLRIENEKSQDSYETSSSEPKKAPQIFKRVDGRGSKYDNQGIHKETLKDLCDCLTVDCPGCFMPCPRCSSCKCGHECRRSRRWIYESFEIEGTSLIIRNQFKR